LFSIQRPITITISTSRYFIASAPGRTWHAA
jgi:hypothetical protein